MLTNEDIQKLSEIVATKDDVTNLVTQLVTQKEFAEFREDADEKFDSLRMAIENLIISVDKLTKTVENLSQEYVFINSKLDRHEKWIQLLAEKLGVKLEY
ncbi:MAG: hypothetical protein V1892_03740 [bacterium]